MERAEAYYFLLVVFATVFWHTASSKSINYTDCGSKEAKIESLDITPCDDDPCRLKIGTAITGTLTFSAKDSFSGGRVKAVVNDYFPLPVPADACKGYGIQCPVKNGQTVHLVATEKIENYYPRTKLLVRGELSDLFGNTVVCIEANVVITD